MSCNHLLRRSAPLILAPALLGSTILSANTAEPALAAAVAPGNGAGAGLRPYLALGALAAAGLAYAGYSWFAPDQDAQAPLPVAADSGALAAVADVTYQAVVTPALAAAGQILARQALVPEFEAAMADPAAALAGPDLGAAPAMPEAPSHYFNFTPASGVEVTPAAIRAFEQARRVMQHGVFNQLQKARMIMNNHKDWVKSAERLPGVASMAFQQDCQLKLETSRSIYDLYEALYGAIRWTTPVYLGDPMGVRNPPLDLTASLSRVAALERNLNAIHAKFQPTAWAVIARDANSPDLGAQSREDRMREALQALEEIREGLVPLGAAS